MVKIARFNGNVQAFASNQQSGERRVFGATTPTESDLLSDQLTPEFLRGWGTVSASEFPPIEWFNALGYTVTQFISYLHQMGVAEWNAEQEYHLGSLVSYDGDIYLSTTNDNIGNDPSSNDGNWYASSKKEFKTLDDAILNPSLKLGQRIRIDERSTGNGGSSVWEVTNDSPDGFGVVDATASGFSLTLVDNGQFVLLESLGAKDDMSFDSGPAINYGIQNYRYLTASAKRTFYTSEEIIPTDGTVLMALTSSNSTALDTLKFAKFSGSDFTGKAIVRASKSPMGGAIPASISGALLGPFEIDAEGADCGFYARYLTNESEVKGVVVRNSTVCDIAIITTWFAKYGKLVSTRAKNVGISLGHPLFGETGDVAVNAIEFESVRANRSGQGSVNMATWVDGVNVLTNALNGAGIILATNACNFPVIQAEKCIGVGIVDNGPFSNSFGTVYTENNTDQLTTGRRDFVGLNSGSGKVTTAQNIFIGGVGDNAYELEANSLIQANYAGRNSASNTFFSANDDQVILNSSNSLVQSNQDVSVLKTVQSRFANFYNINHRYSGEYVDARFYSESNISFPYVVIVPRATITTSSTVAISIDGNLEQSYGTNFTAGVPVVRRHASVSSGDHKLSSVGTLPAADSFFDIYVFERKPAPGFFTVG
ncbi:hypothetical protein [Vibrio phage XM1]|nr:hypothetical protein [Vibrio phage XM1]